MTNQYLTILIESLQKKSKALCGVIFGCQVQGAIAELVNLIYIGPFFDTVG